MSAAERLSIAAPSVAASTSVATAGIGWIARTIERGVVAAEPVGEAQAAAGIIATLSSGTVASGPAIGATLPQPSHQQIADQRGPADRCSEYRHRARHGFCSRKRRKHPGLCTAKTLHGPAFVVKCDGS